MSYRQFRAKPEHNKNTLGNRELHTPILRLLQVFRGTKTDDPRLLAEGFDTRIEGGEVNLRLLGGRMNRYADSQEELVDATGRVHVEQLSPTRTNVRPLMGNITWAVGICPRAPGSGDAAHDDFKDAAYDEKGFILVKVLVKWYALMASVFDEHPRGGVSRIGAGCLHGEVVERIPIPSLGR